MLLRPCFQHLPSIERKRIEMPERVVLRLNRGERPVPLPSSIRSEIAARFHHYSFQQYPSYTPFYDKLSSHIGFSKEQICVGAGIEEFIRTLTFLCCDPGQRVAVTWPTCAMYGIYALAFGAQLIKLQTNPDAPRWDVDKLLGYLSETSPRLLFLPNPGQPVETYFSLDELKVIADWCRERDIVLAVDEAHHGFGASSALEWGFIPPNVLVLRTFSKFFSAASIRVGYAVGHPTLIKALHAVRPSGEISGPSLVIASILLDHAFELEVSAKATGFVRNGLVAAINGATLPCRASGEWGFSVLLRFPSEQVVKAVGDALWNKGVLTKYGFPDDLVSSCMLISCGDAIDMRKFYHILSSELT